MSCSSYLDGFSDGRLVAVQLLFCGMLLPWFFFLLLSSVLLLEQYPACLVRPIWMVLVMGGWWLYSCCFVGCCFHGFFNTVFAIAVKIFLHALSHCPCGAPV